MNASIKYMVNGREVTAEEWVQNQNDRILAAAADKIASQIGALRCDVHDQGPTVTVTRTDDTRANLAIQGCCPALKAKAQGSVEQSGARRAADDQA